MGEKDCGVSAGMGMEGEQSQLFQGRHREREVDDGYENGKWPTIRRKPVVFHPRSSLQGALNRRPQKRPIMTAVASGSSTYARPAFFCSVRS